MNQPATPPTRIYKNPTNEINTNNIEFMVKQNIKKANLFTIDLDYITQI